MVLVLSGLVVTFFMISPNFLFLLSYKLGLSLML